MSTAIVISNLQKQYPAAPKPACSVDALRIEPGELFFLLGPSGCGKTTLLRMIAGFIEPTAGTIGFATSATGPVTDVTHLPPNKRNTGMVFQSYALWPHMTVFQNVAFGLEVRKIDKEQIMSRVREALAMVQMEHLAERKPNALSGGQQQRVALARALVVRPDVLLLDEPLSNLDAKLRVDLRGEIRRICKSSGITTVYVTHDQKEALSMADRCAIMRQGRIEQLGTPAAMYHHPASTFVAEFLGETNFIDGTITSVNQTPAGPEAAIETPHGTLVSRSVMLGQPGAGRKVKLSIRPEAFSLLAMHSAEAPSRLQGTLKDQVYLGESLQLHVELTGNGSAPQTLKVTQLNPGLAMAAAAAKVGSSLTLSVRAEDVITLPEDVPPHA
jgi:iron(III) transport system ATP-binding protein